ncbi:P-loop containing nucleoside triphosphate hydrolase [Sesbania bispinosa]|nr:P-loop containing nucleoside triphosphate hydrolase [Sesbania bispinosa]
MEDFPDQDAEESHNKCVSGRCPKKCLSNYKLGKKSVKMFKEMDELLTSGKRFVDKNVDIAYKVPHKPIYGMPSGKTIGLDRMLNQVWNSLEDDNVGIIGLYGMGGAGKTTLMNRIHNELGKRENNFALVLWVVVSKDRDINKTMNDIRNKLRISDDIWNRSSQDEKVTKIYQVLKQKKFLLMLDDLWEKLELEMVGVPNPEDVNNQSKVLFTTRLEDVCAKMQAQKKFKVECLSEREAFDLFCKKVGDETLKCHMEIPKLAWEMAKECEGLPLALITVGSAMAGVKSIEAWRQAKNNLRSSPWTASDLEEKVFRILKFSYDRLPDETHKSCFLYCALYPEDYEVRVNDLIDRWIGEGFLGKDKIKKSIYDMYEQGESIVEKLKLSCLLEGVSSGLDVIKMHDVIRDMALWLVRDQDGNKDKVVIQGEALAMSEMDFERLKLVERISLIVQVREMCVWQWQVPVCPNLITLCCIQQNFDKASYFGQEQNSPDYSNLQFMTRLKVLDLSGFEEAFLEKLESLPKLEELCIELTTIIGIHKLLESIKLQGCSRYVLLNGIKDPLEMASLLASWSRMKHLERIGLNCLDNIMEGSSITHTCHFHKLRRVVISGCDSITHLNWLRYALLLEFLEVKSCHSVEQVLKEAEDVGSSRDNAKDIFPNLRHLRLHYLPKLKSIHIKALALPFLKHIDVHGCPNLRKLPFNSSSAAKDSLIGIIGPSEWCTNLEWEDTTTKDLLHSKFQPF